MDFMQKLGIKEKNFGSCTGTQWLKTVDQDELKIYSPTMVNILPRYTKLPKRL